VSRNVVRVAILIWFAISMYSGFTSWTDHQVPVVVEVPVTDQNLSGRITEIAEYECPAPIGGSGAPKLLDDLTDVVGPSREPCSPYLRGRQVLFWIDVLAFVGAMSLTFAHLPRRLRDRREAAGHAVTV
jgi:hypothetical protein